MGRVFSRAVVFVSLCAVLGAFVFQKQLSTPGASADTTGVAVIGCEFLADGVDGVAGDLMTESAADQATDVAAACGTGATPLPPVSTGEAPSIANLASVIGDQDGTLELSDFSTPTIDEKSDDNQLSTACTAAGPFCTLDVFVFVDDEAPVTFDLPSGLASVEAGALDFTCSSEGSLITDDNDCARPFGADANGDGVVLFHIMDGTATAGDVKTVNVGQESVVQFFDVNVVGQTNAIQLTLVETTIESNASAANVTACQTNTSLIDAIAPTTSTLAYAQVSDADGTLLTRIPVSFSTSPAVSDVAKLGLGPFSNSNVTVHPSVSGAPIAAYVVICAGKDTGTATIQAAIVATSAVTIATDASSSADITVTGVPACARADVDGNGHVDHIDIRAVAHHVGQSKPYDVQFDVNLDGTVNSKDLVALNRCIVRDGAGT